ncbi:glucose 1-dehydrogenase [Weissella cibaria]|uniref:glucose 1-dehydrogenase n=1 Tax=Weissella cibaria TaxID=137591 RepID=UPI001132253D|nr:glucose 1-dehydrogenase [Weissella cibaria]QDG81608.1 glucose 1-dehydrogenase [Weissella cibaria]
MVNRLTGKVAIVTGGTTGLGKAIAQCFIEEGAKVVITGRRANVGEAAAKELGGEDVIRFQQHDSSDEQGWQDLIAYTEEAFGPLNVLVNNAGIGATNDIEHDTFDAYRKLMSINADGMYLGTQYGFRAMKEHGGGSIINMSSILGLVGDTMTASYNASKGAVRMFSKSAAVYAAQNDLNIRVNTVHPGYIATPMTDGSGEGDSVAPYVTQRLKTPMGRMGEPDDIAWICVYLASEESKFATGAEFVIDGGYTAQ